MQISKLTFLALFSVSTLVGCKKDLNPVDPVENQTPALVKTIIRPNIEAIKRNSRTPTGALDKIVTEVEGEQFANHMPGTRQYLYDNAGRNIGFADQLSPKNSTPGFCDVVYEYKDDKLFRMYFTVRGEGYWGELEPNLIMREFAYDKSDRIVKAYVYYVDRNDVATLGEGDAHSLKYDNEGRLIELSTTGVVSQKTVYKYTGNNLESAFFTFSQSPGNVSAEYSYEYKYDNTENGLKNLPEIPKLFHPGPSFFDQLFGDNNLVSLKVTSKYYPTTTSGSQMNIEYSTKFDGAGRVIEKTEDFKDNTPLVKKLYYYK